MKQAGGKFKTDKRRLFFIKYSSSALTGGDVGLKVDTG